MTAGVHLRDNLAMAPVIDRTGIARILRIALLLSVLAYPAVAMLGLGAPDWKAPWIPAEQPASILLVVLGALALGEWAVGRLVGNLKQPPRFMAASTNPAGFAFVRFLVALALMEGGAIMGLALAFITHDSRYAVAFAAPACLLMLLVPAPERERGAGQAGPA